MKKVKRLISCLLSAALLAGLLGAFSAGAAGVSGFYDITDPQVANAAEVLRLLGVVDGTGGGAFRPSGTLTRAEFCKMTVEIMGRGDEEPAQRGRTIFQDVTAKHWARGYVNLASSITLGGGEDQNATRLIMGVGDGTFQPDRAITFGEAAAILMRVLGYGNADVAPGIYWYDGYVAIAKSAGLADGLSLDGSSTLTRGQAALLFYNLLFTKSKGSDDIYLTRQGGSLHENVIILSTDATAEDGSTGSVLTTDGTYKTDHASFDTALNGKRGSLVLDSKGKLLCILSDENSTFRAVTVMGTPQANAIPVMGDESLSVKLTTAVYQSDSAEPTTYEQVWTSLRTGTNLLLCYNGSGKLDYIYQRTGSDAVGDDNVMVAKKKPAGTANPFASIMGGSAGAQIYKNGAPAEIADLQQYDVGTYDKASNTLFVSDLKLTGLYEDAYPNTTAPSTIKVMGAQFTVLPSAMQDLSSFRIGDRMTLLLTTTGQVAGAVPTSTARGNAVGVATVNSAEDVSIQLLDGIITLSGKTTYSDTAAMKLNGYLVSVSSSQKGYLTLNRLTGREVTDSLDLVKNTLGRKALSPAVRFYEQVSNSALAEIKRSDIVLSKVPAGKIIYASYDSSGRVDKIVLDDVTGDRYTYGMVYYEQAGIYEETMEDGTIVSGHRNGTLRITNSRGSVTFTVGTVEGAKGGAMGGAVAALNTLDGNPRLAGFTTVQSLSKLTRSQFDADGMTLTTASLILPIAEDVQVYNDATDSWYTAEDARENLRLALAFSNELTAYYDRAPEDGGKVRILVAK